jgi:hypothetical protein
MAWRNWVLAADQSPTLTRDIAVREANTTEYAKALRVVLARRFGAT